MLVGEDVHDGEAAPEESEIQLNLALNIRIPNDYIPEENQRLRMYKRVAGVQGEPQLNEVRAELEDRYGPLPGAVRLSAEDLTANSAHIPRDREIILFCT